MPETYDLVYRLGECAAALLAAPDSYDRQRKLREAVELYDQWRVFGNLELTAPEPEATAAPNPVPPKRRYWGRSTEDGPSL